MLKQYCCCQSDWATLARSNYVPVFAYQRTFLTCVHSWLHGKDAESQRHNTLWMLHLNVIQVYFDMQICPLRSLSKLSTGPPSEAYVASWNTSFNLTWPNLEDFGVIVVPPGHVDSHVRREVEGGLPDSVFRLNVRRWRFVPAAVGQTKIRG